VLIEKTPDTFIRTSCSWFKRGNVLRVSLTDRGLLLQRSTPALAQTLKNFKAVHRSIQYHKLSRSDSDVWRELKRKISMRVRFTLKSLFAHRVFAKSRIDGMFSDLIAGCVRENEYRCYRALKSMSEFRLKYLKDPVNTFYNIYASTPLLPELPCPPTHAIVYQVIVTPCRIYPCDRQLGKIIPPLKSLIFVVLPVESNRALRLFSPATDFFLQVRFRDENFRAIFAEEKELIDEWVGSRLRKLKFMGRSYRFLAYSNSQIRVHSAWFVALPDRIPIDTIRSFLSFFFHCNCICTKGKNWETSMKISYQNMLLGLVSVFRQPKRQVL